LRSSSSRTGVRTTFTATGCSARSTPAQPVYVEDLERLQPYPDRLLDDLVTRETVELAVITAIQLLPAKRRAVLILRDVLGWSAKEVAEALGDSVGAVTSALQRARKCVSETRRSASVPDQEQQALVERFMAAWVAVDIDGLVALLTEDAVMTMPPQRMRVEGAIGQFFATVPQHGRLDEILLLQTATNRQPALAAYARHDDGKNRPYGLMVLQLEPRISTIVGFPDPWLFEQCGLPRELSTSDRIGRVRGAEDGLDPSEPLPVSGRRAAVASPGLCPTPSSDLGAEA
jgi:RNA polymerase sigma-70 factor (ECF subfamily)